MVTKSSFASGTFAPTITLAVVMALSGCGSKDGSGETPSQFAVEVPSFKPAPRTLPANVIPQPDQLTALYSAAFDLDISPQDRARLFESRGGDTIGIANAILSGDSLSSIHFDSLRDLGNGKIEASGRAVIKGRRQVEDGGPAGPVPFVAENGEWKVGRDFGCAIAAAYNYPCVD